MDCEGGLPRDEFTLDSASKTPIRGVPAGIERKRKRWPVTKRSPSRKTPWTQYLRRIASAPRKGVLSCGFQGGIHESPLCIRAGRDGFAIGARFRRGRRRHLAEPNRR